MRYQTLIGDRDTEIFRPLILHPKNSTERAEFYKLFHTKGVSIIDTTQTQKKEYRLVLSPKGLLQEANRSRSRAKTYLTEGVWIYYPWSHALVHIIPEKAFQKLRLSRNHNLILPREEKNLGKLRIGIAGLNVGNPAAICLALEGIGGSMKFADNDVLDLSNLNRFRAGLPDLGINKAVLSARQAYEINPFLNISVYTMGIQKENLDEFLLYPKIDILIEETDNLPLKIIIREHARAHGIPVLMVTGNCSGLILDVERFDKDQNLPLLSGHLRQNVIKAITDPNMAKLKVQEKIFLARDFMGSQYLAPRLRQSFIKVGKTLAGIPQLAEASFLRGAVLTYAVKMIATNKKLSSGRYRVDLDRVVC